MKPALLFLFALLTFAAADAQTIRGTVRDADSREPLEGVIVVALRDSFRVGGAVSDVSGSFRIDSLPLGRTTVVVQMIGYEPRVLSNLLLISGKEMVLEIGLQEAFQQTEAVVITPSNRRTDALNDYTTVSGRAISVEETQRYAATFLDPARMVQATAGVANGGSDVSNEIVVRGNSPRGVLWRMEGIEIPNPNHFANIGTPGGGISMLSSSVLGTSDFLTGAFPAEYGNALSSVFDLNLRTGNNEKRESSFMMGLIGTELASEGPFSKKCRGSYLANYRYSTLGLLGKMGIHPTGSVIPAFQDLSFKLNFPTRKLGTFSLFGLAGYSIYHIDPVNDSTQWKSYLGNRKEEERAFTGFTGLTHIVSFSQNTYLKTVALVSYNSYEYTRWLLQPSQDYFAKLDFRERYYRAANRFSITLNHKFSARSKLRAGAIGSQLGYNLNFGSVDTLTNLWQTHFNTRGTDYLLQGFVQWQYRFTERLSLNTGLHGLLRTTNSTYSVEPRLGLKWQASQRHAFGLGTGVHSRVEDVTTYYAQRTLADGTIITPNKALKIPKALHTVLSYDFYPVRNFRFRAEAYFQYLYQLPVVNRASDPVFIWNYRNIYGFVSNVDTFVSRGVGRNYGIEFTFEKSLSNRWYGMFTSSLFKSQYQGLDHVWRSTRFNTGYVLNLMGGREFVVGKRKRNLVGLNFRALAMGGQHYTGVNLTETLTQQYLVLSNNPMSLQLPFYYRVDGGISYKINRQRVTHDISLNIQNLTNHLNVFTRDFSLKDGKMVDTYQLGTVPILNYRVNF